MPNVWDIGDCVILLHKTAVLIFLEVLALSFADFEEASGHIGESHVARNYRCLKELRVALNPQPARNCVLPTT